ADARIAADAVEGRPLNVGEIDATLQHQVFEQAADFVFDDGADHGGAQAEAAAQPAADVVLAAAFPDMEAARRADAAFTGIEPQHDLAERGSVPTATLAGFDGQCHCLFPSPNRSDQVQGGAHIGGDARIIAGLEQFAAHRSEEHTSELQSLTNLVC